MKKVYLLIVHLVFLIILKAQPGALDLRFDPGAGANEKVRKVLLLPDKKLMIVGDFTQYDGHVANRIARLLPSGKIDTTFMSVNGFNDRVWAIERQADGRLLIGGDFTTYQTDSFYHLIRLMPDGAIDSSFHMGKGLNDRAECIKQQPDGKIIMAGLFTFYNDTAANRIIRLNPNGSIDPNWDRSYGADDGISTLHLLPNGQMMIGGEFVFYGGNSLKYVHIRFARVNADGSCDTLFSSINASRTVNSIDTFSNTELIVGGYFINYDQQPRAHIVRTSRAGVANASFSTSNGSDRAIDKVKIIKNDQMIISGLFNTYNNDSVFGITRINYDGSRDSIFNSGTGISLNPLFYTRILDFNLSPDEDQIYIGGNFWEYNGITRYNIARLYNCLSDKPLSIAGKDSTECAGEQFRFEVPIMAGVTKYKWTLPNGWLGVSDSNVMMATSNGTAGIIKVQAFTDSCGYSLPTIKPIYLKQSPAVPICLVTVDEISNHNFILWEKPNTLLIDSFFIYRETSTNQYNRIGAVSYDSIPSFEDTVANPNITSYRYKLSALSKCGVESAFSPFHSTIHLQEIGTGNFLWNFYQIEGFTNPVTNYNVYRDLDTSGNFVQIGLLPGTNSSFTDVNAFAYPNTNYRVDVTWNKSCANGTVNTTRSNIKQRRKPDGINSLDDDYRLTAYPNPANDFVSIQTNVPNDFIKKIVLVNSLGQSVAEQPGDNRKISTANLPNGVYSLKVQTSQAVWSKAIIIERN